LAISEESVLYGYYIIADPNSVKQTLMNLKDVGPLFFLFFQNTTDPGSKTGSDHYGINLGNHE
jgi:hypothetical protein